jgi:hypothetical protein
LLGLKAESLNQQHQQSPEHCLKAELGPHSQHVKSESTFYQGLQELRVYIKGSESLF